MAMHPLHQPTLIFRCNRINGTYSFSFQNGVISALPYLCSLCFSIIWGQVADWLVVTHKLSLTTTRKLSTNVGLVGSAIGLLGLTFAKCDHTMAIILLCVSYGTAGAVCSGYEVKF